MRKLGDLGALLIALMLALGVVGGCLRRYDLAASDRLFMKMDHVTGKAWLMRFGDPPYWIEVADTSSESAAPDSIP